MSPGYFSLPVLVPSYFGHMISSRYYPELLLKVHSVVSFQGFRRCSEYLYALSQMSSLK